MSAPQRLTGDELAAIKARAEASAGVAGFATIHYALATEDVPRLVAEVESLRAALNFKQGTIDDLAATVERLEGERDDPAVRVKGVRVKILNGDQVVTEGTLHADGYVDLDQTGVIVTSIEHPDGYRLPAIAPIAIQPGDRLRFPPGPPTLT